MAEVPHLIKACFVDEVVNSAGCYLINFFVNGIKTAIMVDDWIPTYYGRPKFAFARIEVEKASYR